MVWCIAAVAKEENIFVVGMIADRAWLHFLLFFGILVEPCLRVKLGDLFFVLNLVRGYQGTFLGLLLAGFNNTQVGKGPCIGGDLPPTLS
jgi:hypothetical protein